MERGPELRAPDARHRAPPAPATRRHDEVRACRGDNSCQGDPPSPTATCGGYDVRTERPAPSAVLASHWSRRPPGLPLLYKCFPVSLAPRFPRLSHDTAGAFISEPPVARSASRGRAYARQPSTHGRAPVGSLYNPYHSLGSPRWSVV
ncbi:unnamed protein product [Gadus morhua 'NCC']